MTPIVMGIDARAPIWACVVAAAVLLSSPVGAAEPATVSPSATEPDQARFDPAALPGAYIPAPAGPVLAPLDAVAPAPSAAGLARELAGLLDAGSLGGTVAAQVVDLADGEVLLSRSADRAAVPASTAKILTAVAVLSLRGPDSTLATRVVEDSTGSGPGGAITLVGGGDVLLAAGTGDEGAVVGHAGLDDLAAATAARLTAAGRTTVALTVDDSLFTGPATNPSWRPGDVGGGFVAPVTALAVDSGNATPGRRPAAGQPFARSADPALAAARAFVVALTRHGVAVTGAPTRRKMPVAQDAPVLAEVRSARLADLVEQSLTDSDNTAAEALGRLVAVSSNYPATFVGAGQAILNRLALLGVPTAGQRMSGASGLGGGYALSPATLVAALRLSGAGEHPELRPVLSGLPVAGASGTLLERFAAERAGSALGAVRAKTGTLTGASSLAGTVVDADGRLLAFAVLADAVASTEAARSGLDLIAATLAGCGCR